MSCEKEFWTVWKNPYLKQEIFSKNRSLNSIAAAKTGNMDAFKYSVLTNYSTWTMDYAAYHSQIDVLKWLWKNRSEGCTYRSFLFTIQHGDLNTLKWLYQNVELTDEPIDYVTEFVDIASKHGHLHIVKWLMEYGEKPSSWAMDYAAMNGHLHVLKWLYSQNVPCSHWAIDTASEYGHFDTVKWLLSINAECSDWALQKSAQNGHFDIVVLLMNTGLECTIWAFYDAVIHGHLNIVKYIYYNSNIRKNINKDDILAELKTQNAQAYEMINFIESIDDCTKK